jgi:hypothetical protein
MIWAKTVLFKKFHRRKNLIALFLGNFVLKRELRTRNFKILSPMGIRVERNWSSAKLIKPIVLKDAYTYKKQLLLYNFSKFWVRLAAPRPQILNKWSKNSKIYSFSNIFSKVLVQKRHILACLTRLVNAFKEKITVIDLQ